MLSNNSNSRNRDRDFVLVLKEKECLKLYAYSMMPCLLVIRVRWNDVSLRLTKRKHSQTVEKIEPSSEAAP